jgi:hypothetical protein
MRKYQRAAVVMAVLGSVSFLGAGVSQAGEGSQNRVDATQVNACKNEGRKSTSFGLINALNEVNVGLGILGKGEADNSTTQNCVNGLEIK